MLPKGKKKQRLETLIPVAENLILNCEVCEIGGIIAFLFGARGRRKIPRTSSSVNDRLECVGYSRTATYYDDT